MQVPALTHPMFYTHIWPSDSKAALDIYSAVSKTVLCKPLETLDLLHQLLLLTSPSKFCLETSHSFTGHVISTAFLGLCSLSACATVSCIRTTYHK